MSANRRSQIAASGKRHNFTSLGIVQRKAEGRIREAHGDPSRISMSWNPNPWDQRSPRSPLRGNFLYEFSEARGDRIRRERGGSWRGRRLTTLHNRPSLVVSMSFQLGSLGGLLSIRVRFTSRRISSRKTPSQYNQIPANGEQRLKCLFQARGTTAFDGKFAEGLLAYPVNIKPGKRQFIISVTGAHIHGG